MHLELQVLETNHTWGLIPLPPNQKPIGCHWVFKTKLYLDGIVDRYKACLVAKGYHPIEGVDYFDSFSPVAKSVIVRLFLVMATALSRPIHQLDINNAFLHGFLDEEVYILQPEGYPAAQLDHVCLLRRSL